MAVVFLAALVRSTFGFGEALVAVPLLALLMPVDLAAPVSALVSITIAAVVLLQDRADVHARTAGWLVLSTLPGIPLGLLLLTRVAEPAVKSALGVVIIAFSLYSLAGSRSVVLKSDRTSWLFGFSAGILGGAYAMNGPPLVIYGALRRWSPLHFRATLQGYFLPASLTVMSGYWAVGLWTPDVTRYYMTALPGVVIAIFIGRLVNRRLDAPRFLSCIHGALLLVGATLLIQALSG